MTSTTLEATPVARWFQPGVDRLFQAALQRLQAALKRFQAGLERLFQAALQRLQAGLKRLLQI